MSTAMDTAPAMAITTYHQCQEKAGGDDGPEGEAGTETDEGLVRWVFYGEVRI